VKVTTLPKALVERVSQGLAEDAGRHARQRHGGHEKMIAEADGPEIGYVPAAPSVAVPQTQGWGSVTFFRQNGDDGRSMGLSVG
jgi:hypothetical protein